MVNGTNGANGAGVFNVNPVEAAQFALHFLQGTTLKPAERQAFNIAEAFLQAIASGQVVIMPPPQQQPLAPAIIEGGKDDA